MLFVSTLNKKVGYKSNVRVAQMLACGRTGKLPEVAV